MKRIGVLLILIAIMFIYSCGQKTVDVQQTGLELRFSNCFVFGVWVWLDGEYQGTFTSEKQNFISVGAGSHTLYARSNMVLTGTKEYYCWTQDFSVTQDKVTTLLLDCEGHTCLDTTITITQ